MKLAVSSTISEIDAFCETELGISVKSLMEKSGTAVADAARKRTQKGGKILVLAGKGNNGGDGYAAACELIEDYNVKVYDVLGMGQKSEAGKFFLEKFRALGGAVENYTNNDEFREEVNSADCIVDAVFGTGFVGEMPEALRQLAITVRESVGS